MSRPLVRSLAFTLATLLGSAVLVAPDATAEDWTGTLADQMISFDDNEYTYGVQLVIDEMANRHHAFWAEDAPSVREVHYGRSEDGGLSWSSSAGDRVISFPDGTAVYEEPDAVVVGRDTLVVVWSEDEVATREVHFGVSIDGGATFSCQTQDLILSDPATAVDTGVPSVAVDSDRTLHVVWQQVVNGAAEVHYARSADLGATWTGASGDRIISFPDGNGAITPQIVVGENDRLIVAWRETGDSGQPAVHVGISDDGGATWTSESADHEISQPVRLMTDLAASAIPYWANQDGHVYVVYQASFDTASPYHYEIYVTLSDDNGATWSGESATTTVSFDEDHTRSASRPDVFVSECSGVFAVWQEQEDIAGTTEQHVSRSTDGGATWSGATGDEIISFPDGENGYRPSVSGYQAINPVGQQETVFVAWTEFAGDVNDNYEVHLSRAIFCVNGAVDASDAVAGFRVQALPNPARGSVTIRLDAALEDHQVSGLPVDVAIFDAAGRLVRRLDGRLDDAGVAGIVWDGRDLRGEAVAPGVYWARLGSGTGTTALRLVMR